MDLCLILSNLLENALEASRRTASERCKINLTAYIHAENLALIQVENTFDGELREKNGILQSSKRKGDGVGLQSVSHIAEKNLVEQVYLHIMTVYLGQALCFADSYVIL